MCECGSAHVKVCMSRWEDKVRADGPYLPLCLRRVSSSQLSFLGYLVCDLRVHYSPVPTSNLAEGELGLQTCGTACGLLGLKVRSSCLFGN